MASEVFQFDEFLLDPAKRELQGRGELIVLTPHVFDCLTYLITHRERAVGRDELIAAVWGRADISDTLLAQTVMHARRAVGDSGGEQRSIRTIPRFGYRWIDEDTQVLVATDGSEAAVDDRPPAPTADARTPMPRHRPILLAIAALLLVALLAVLVLLARTGTGPLAPEAAGPAPAIGVEPLLVLPVTISVGADSAWVPLGLMDSIAGRLRDAGWAVVPSPTVVAMAGRGETTGDQNIRELAAMTGAGLVIQPQAQRQGDGWLVQLALTGPDDVPGSLSGSADELLEAARLASDRLVALLLREPLPESVVADPDAASAELIQRVEAEFLANRLEAAESLLESLPLTWQSRPEFRYQRAHLDYRAGRLVQAETGLQALIDDLPEGLPSEPGMMLRARALIGLGSIARTRARFEPAAAFYEQAIAHLDAGRQPSLTGMALAYLGISRGSLGQFEQATAGLARARVLLDGTGDAIGVAIVDAGMATIQADRRRLPDALSRLDDAVRRFDLLGAESEAFDKRIALTQMSREVLDTGAALEYSSAVWKRAGTDHSQRLFTMAAALRAMTLIDAGQLNAARDVLETLAGSGQFDRHSYQGRQAALAQVLLHLAESRHEEAETGLLQLLADPLVETTGDLGYLRRLWSQALRGLNRAGEIDAALPELERWADGQSKPFKEIELRWVQAEAELGAGRTEAAWEHFDRALALADELGVPASIAAVAQRYGQALIQSGEPARAAPVVGRIAVWSDRSYACALLEVELFHALALPGSWRRALERARTLAGERNIPARLLEVPAANPP